jgi:hypothetical protein
MSLDEHSEVAAARDLKRGRDVTIRKGTPGAVTRSNRWFGLHTVEFRPVDDVDTRVTVRGLRERDLTLNAGPQLMPAQPDRRAT